MFTNAHLIRDAEVALENTTVEELTALVSPMLGSRPIPGGFLLFSYDIFDATDAYQQWDKTADVLGITEGQAFLREFDIRPFAVTFSLSGGSSSLLRNAVPFLAEWIAHGLASEIGRRVLLTFNEGEIPYRLYQNNQIVRDFGQYYNPVLGSRIVTEFGVI